MVEPQNPDRMKERAAASDGLVQYLVRKVPLVAAIGGFAGLFFSFGAPVQQIAFSAAMLFVVIWVFALVLRAAGAMPEPTW